MTKYDVLFLEPLIMDAMDENEAKLYLKKSKEEYKNFLAQVISTSSWASFSFVRDMIENFMNNGTLEHWKHVVYDTSNNMPLPTIDWVKEYERNRKFGCFH